ncbi:MAG: hypothetical protein PHC88_09870 [Terrimicrobiaceae bacterium]|nr:hypothetical protein [Terrimicrobiaceae bacterium]
MRGISVHRRSSFVVLIALVLCAGIALYVVPAWNNARVVGEMTGALNDARHLQIAIQMMSMDHKNGGEHSGGALPADLGVKSEREYFQRITRDSYMAASDIERIRGRNEFSIANAASTDPPDTAFIVSNGALHPDAHHRGGFVVFTLGGSGGVYKRPTDAGNPSALKLPNRQPQILPKE